ncbi:hypothetical protein [Micromonospora carbonacea]|uniref:hypothetical protein n=1 Tax=Micromonospora carbonacea TaxID=47853 RepID=UPI0037196F81
MIRVVRANTIADLQYAVFALRNLAAHLADGHTPPPCAGDGCCGCGRWMADVVTPTGEGYCRRCVASLGVAGWKPFTADGLTAEGDGVMTTITEITAADLLTTDSTTVAIHPGIPFAWVGSKSVADNYANSIDWLTVTNPEDDDTHVIVEIGDDERVALPKTMTLVVKAVAL